MVFNGLAFGLLETIVFGWICIFSMLVCLYVWKGDFKSSYNYRPWKIVDIPEDVATKIDKEAAKLIVFIDGAFLCAMTIGWVYSIVSGDYNNLQFILLASLIGWVLILLALIVIFLVYAWFVDKKYKTGKT
ncbi:hypothetical protein MCP_0928 [Methanocella paludicola SANAE]|uniref:DUF3784 domain-containing protein n=2 Tax=Methanocella TaxID=570266 RepID=D1YX28_METPS|nr:hypothetical protein MCP_0928 [Methanocella paludicola SANAE]